MKYTKQQLITTLILVTFAAPCTLAATDFSYELRAGGGHSDNIRRSDIDKQDESIAIVGINVEASGESRRFEGNLFADVELRRYVDDVFGDENFSSLDGSLLFKVAPEIFEWAIEDRFGVTQRDPFGADTVENRENVNVFSTGPNLFLKFGDRTSIELNGRYRDTNFEESNSDSSTLSGVLSLIRALSPKRSLSLNVTSDRIELDDVTSPSGNGFDRRSAYIEFSSLISRGTLNIALGINELHDRGTSFDGTLASVSWSRNISPTSSISLAYSQRYSDAGDIFRQFDSLANTTRSTRNIIPIADALEIQRLSANYSFVRRNNTFSFTGYFNDDEYETNTELDSQRIGGRLSISRSFGSGWTLGGSVRVEQRDFDLLNRKDDYLDAGINVDRRFTRTLLASFIYQHADRSSNDVGQDYTENRYTLLIRYSPDN